MDLAHVALICGMVKAYKPNAVLELGIGTGTLTRALLDAIDYNTQGELHCVDNWVDDKGIEPGWMPDIRRRGARIIIMGEEAFCQRTPSDRYGILISDADHHGTWQDEHLRLVKQGGVLFFHDTGGAFPALAGLEQKFRAQGHFAYNFTANSRPDEHCERGLLMVIKA